MLGSWGHFTRLRLFGGVLGLVALGVLALWHISLYSVLRTYNQGSETGCQDLRSILSANALIGQCIRLYQLTIEKCRNQTWGKREQTNPDTVTVLEQNAATRHVEKQIPVMGQYCIWCVSVPYSLTVINTWSDFQHTVPILKPALGGNTAKRARVVGFLQQTRKEPRRSVFYKLQILGIASLKALLLGSLHTCVRDICMGL